MRCEELNQSEKIQAKAELLQKMRRRDLIKDTKKNCLKRNIEFVNPRLNINEYLTQTSEDRLPQKHDQAAKEVHSYKVALENSQKVLRQLEDMKIKN